MTVYGLDISHWQNGLKLSTGRDQGFVFVMAKMTEGNSITDPNYAGFRDAAKAEKLLFAAYHFLRSDIDPVAQANYAVSKLGDKSIPIMVDVETKDLGGGKTSKPTLAQTKKFIDAVKAAGGNVSLVYLPHWYWQGVLKSPSLRGLPPIVASNYVAGTGYASVLNNKVTADQWAAYGGKTPVILQISSKGVYTGYSGNVDFDVFKGTESELKALNLFKDWGAPVNRKFDRVPSRDDRNNDYPVSLLWTNESSCGNLTQIPTLVTKKWDDYAFLDQGNEGACVGFGTSGELAALPDSVTGIDNAYALQLYHDAQQVDEWAGDDYEGTSVLAGAKVATSRGFYSNYLWATKESDVATTVSNYGPVIVGFNWHEDMMDTDSDGFVHATGEVVGGHCVVVIGINVEEGYYTFRNSWGKSWGIGGEGKITRADFAKLMADDGDVCKPTRVDIKPAPEPTPPSPQPIPKNCTFWDKLFNYFSTGKWGC
jgi:GH25 family lysozyme M1 (1,4-beta-N-acetylmuramidase)